MPKIRLVIIALFAIIGGVLAANYMPLLLDRLFVLAQNASGVDEAVQKAKMPTVVRPRPHSEDRGATPETGTKVGESKVGAESDSNGKATGSATPLPPVVPVTQLGPDVASEPAEPAVQDRYPYSRHPSVLLAMALLGIIVGSVVGARISKTFEQGLVRWDDMETGDKVTLFLGIIAGIIASMPFLFVFQGLGGILGPLTTFALTLGCSALAIYALRSMNDVLPWQKSSAKARRTGIKILDTNVIIDGRIHDLVRTGFIEGPIYVPGFVLLELQHIADSADSLRRQRGRRGLDVLRLMQAEFEVEVGTHDRLIPDQRDEVDTRLVRLAKALGGDLVSNDFNLNRVASLQDVRVLNVNDLALALRPNVLPGEVLEVAVNREGNQYDQGVGYLEDGTMVVVERGKSQIGSTVEVSVTQVIQTERGKMIFAEYFPEGAPEEEPESSARRRRTIR